MCVDDNREDGGEQELKQKIAFEDLTREIIDASKDCKGPSHQGKEKYSLEFQGKITNSYTFVHVNDNSVASSPLSVSSNLSICESHDSLPLGDDVPIESVETLIDSIDDLINSSSKINLGPFSIEANGINDGTLSCENYVDQFVGDTNTPLEDDYDEINEP